MLEELHLLSLRRSHAAWSACNSSFLYEYHWGKQFSCSTSPYVHFLLLEHPHTLLFLEVSSHHGDSTPNHGGWSLLVAVSLTCCISASLQLQIQCYTIIHISFMPQYRRSIKVFRTLTLFPRMGYWLNLLVDKCTPWYLHQVLCGVWSTNIKYLSEGLTSFILCKKIRKLFSHSGNAKRYLHHPALCPLLNGGEEVVVVFSQLPSVVILDLAPASHLLLRLETSSPLSNSYLRSVLSICLLLWGRPTEYSRLNSKEK